MDALVVFLLMLLPIILVIGILWVTRDKPQPEPTHVVATWDLKDLSLEDRQWLANQLERGGLDPQQVAPDQMPLSMAAVAKFGLTTAQAASAFQNRMLARSGEYVRVGRGVCTKERAIARGYHYEEM